MPTVSFASEGSSIKSSPSGRALPLITGGGSIDTELGSPLAAAAALASAIALKSLFTYAYCFSAACSLRNLAFYSLALAISGYT